MVPNRSKRHSQVRRLFTYSLVLTGVFAFGSIIYSIAQNRFKTRLDINEAQNALKLSTYVDNLLFKDRLKAEVMKCKPSSILTCKKTLKIASQIRNRSSDYTIVLTKTLNYSPEENIVKEFYNISNRIDNQIGLIFGLSLSKARKDGISTIDAFIEKQLKSKSYNKLTNNLDELVNIEKRFIQRIQGLYVESTSLSVNAQNLYDQLRLSFTVIVVLEISLFIVVNIIDLINNNADPINYFESSLKSIQPKVKPLAVSLMFTFILIVMSQVLLYKEGRVQFIDHCRSLNQQSISFSKNLEAISAPLSNSLNTMLEPPLYCISFVEQEFLNDLESFDNIKSTNDKFRFDNINYKLMLYADSYQESVSSLSGNNSNILFLILVFNVAALVSMSIHFKLDSDDIG